jgi:hypothetical protein
MNDSAILTQVRRNAWWGLGLTVETQVLAGAESILAWMSSFEPPYRRCVIRALQYRMGVGLGGGGDVTLVLASGVSSPIGFASLPTEGGWGFSARFGPESSSAAASAAKLSASLAKRFSYRELRNLAQFGIDRSRSMNEFKDDVADFYDSVMFGVDTAKGRPKVWTFALFGGGFEVAGYYKFSGRIDAVSLR